MIRRRAADDLQLSMQHRAGGLTFALTCFALFAGSVLLMPALNAGYDPVDQTISEGALGRYGSVQVAGLLLLAAGSFALAYCLRWLPAPVLLPTIALISFSAACVAALAVFPTDAESDATTWIGRTHNTAATLAFISNVAAMLWSAHAFRREPRLASFAGLSFAMGVIAFALLAMLHIDAEPRGLVQRAAVACIVSWMSGLTLRLRGLDSQLLTQEP